MTLDYGSINYSETVVDATADTPTHKVDYYKDRVAVETEWNNNDPFYDRDLNNFRLLFELQAVHVGAIITRSSELQDIFNQFGKGASYGQATTHMGRLMQKWKAAVRVVAPSSSSGSPKGCTLTTWPPRHLPPGRRLSMMPRKSMSELLANGAGKFGTILADPPWRFQNRTGKMAPEHRRLRRYRTMTLPEIQALPIGSLAKPKSHLYLWVPNALLGEGLAVMKAWGFTYKTNIVWFKVRRDGGPDGRGVGFYFRNVTELLLFGIHGNLRTLPPGRRQVNIIISQKREHSRKPASSYDLIERCSPGPYLELFARQRRTNWTQWGDEVGKIPEDLSLFPDSSASASLFTGS